MPKSRETRGKGAEMPELRQEKEKREPKVEEELPEEPDFQAMDLEQALPEPEPVTVDVDLPPLLEKEIQEKPVKDDEPDAILSEPKGGSLGWFSKSRIKKIAAPLLVILGIGVAADLKSREVKAMDGVGQESHETISMTEGAIFDRSVQNFDLPDYKESLNDSDVLSFEVEGHEYNMSRGDIALMLDKALAVSDASVRASGVDNFYDLFEGDFSYLTEDGSLAVDATIINVLYNIEPSRLDLLDSVTETTKKERKELRRIMKRDAFVSVPEGAMTMPGALVEFDRRGHETLSDYMDNEEMHDFYAERWDDVMSMSLGMMRDVDWEELGGREKTKMRTIISWIVRTQMDYSTAYVKIADHVAHPGETKKELHLFEPIENWAPGEPPIDPAMTSVVDAQNEFNTAMSAMIKFVEGADHLEDAQREKALVDLNFYRESVSQWQTDQIADLFEDRATYDEQRASILGGDGERWSARAESVRAQGIESVIKQG